jgi:MFS family permease
MSCILSSILIGIFWFTPGNYAMAMLFSGLLGQATGLQVSLPVNDIQEILGPDRGDRFGKYIGMTNMLASPFILTGPVITGLLVERFGINSVAYWSLGGFFGCAAFLTASLKMDDMDKIDGEKVEKQT